VSKRVYLVHAWDEDPQSCWYPWLKETLEAKGVVQIPAMPNPATPEIEAWVNTLAKLIPHPDEQTILVGHSIGCQTILRWLAQLPEDTHMGGAVFVAPWTHLTGLSEASQVIAKPWLETPIDWQAVKAHCPQFMALFSDDDGWVPPTEEKIFQEMLSAKTQVVQRAGHFDGMSKLPAVLEAINEQA